LSEAPKFSGFAFCARSTCWGTSLIKKDLVRYELAVAILSHVSSLEGVYYDPDLQLCIVTTDQHLFKITPLIPAVYELYLTVLTIIKAFDFVSSPSFSTTPMLVSYSQCRPSATHIQTVSRCGTRRCGILCGLCSFFEIGPRRLTTIQVSMAMTVINLIGWYSLPGSYLYLLRTPYWAIMST